MAYPSFDSLTVTTMTLVIPLTGRVNMHTAFQLLPITRIMYETPHRRQKRFKIPHCPIPGSILSMRHLGQTRGIIRSEEGGSFKNSITIDLSTRLKNLSLKLSETKIHTCGSSSLEQGAEGANYILDKLHAIQAEVDYLQAHPDVIETTIAWLKEVTRGEPLNPLTEIGPPGELKLKTDFQLPEVLPTGVDARIATFFLNAAQDHAYHGILCEFWDWLKTVRDVITPDCRIDTIHKAMVNYNYDLNFKIKRYELALLMGQRPGFFARFRNDTEHHVTVEIPYELTTPPTAMRKRRNKIPCHTFLIYYSGKVTQSGPNEELMREAYNRFREAIIEIYDQIVKIVPIKLRYQPIYPPSPQDGPTAESPGTLPLGESR